DGREARTQVQRRFGPQMTTLGLRDGWPDGCPVVGRGLGTMSQKTVQLLIGRIVTDEELRLRFVRQPLETLTALREQGFELTASEIDAVVETDREVWNAGAARIHASLQRCSLCPECPVTRVPH